MGFGTPRAINEHPAFTEGGRRGDRHENVGPGVDEWYEETGEGTSTWNLCENCAPDESGVPSQNFTTGYQNLEVQNPGEPMGGPAFGGGVAMPLEVFSRDEHGDVDYADMHCAECGTGLVHEGDKHTPSAEVNQDGRFLSPQWLHQGR